MESPLFSEDLFDLSNGVVVDVLNGFKSSLPVNVERLSRWMRGGQDPLFVNSTLRDKGDSLDLVASRIEGVYSLGLYHSNGNKFKYSISHSFEGGRYVPNVLDLDLSYIDRQGFSRRERVVRQRGVTSYFDILTNEEAIVRSEYSEGEAGLSLLGISIYPRSIIDGDQTLSNLQDHRLSIVSRDGQISAEFGNGLDGDTRDILKKYIPLDVVDGVLNLGDTIKVETVINQLPIMQSFPAKFLNKAGG